MEQKKIDELTEHVRYLQDGVIKNADTLEQQSEDIDRLYQMIMALYNELDQRKVVSMAVLGDAITKVKSVKMTSGE